MRCPPAGEYARHPLSGRAVLSKSDSGWNSQQPKPSVVCRRRPGTAGERPGRAWEAACRPSWARSEEHTSELQSQSNLVCRLLLEKKKINHIAIRTRLRSRHGQFSHAVDHWNIHTQENNQDSERRRWRGTGMDMTV